MKTFLSMVSMCFSLLASTSSGFAQGTVRGRILDETKSALPGVIVRLELPTDSLRQYITSTDIKGRFIFSGIQLRAYRFTAIAVGRRTLTFSVSLKGDSLDLGDIVMMEQPIAVSGVTVVGRVPPAIQVGDTTVYSAKSVVVNEDATMGDLLSKLPGILISNGTVSAGGENVQQVLVDGKPYFGQDPAIALQNIPASMISKIQVYDQESDQARFTGFDDGQDIKTINIITRNRYDDRKFGTIGGGYGDNRRYNGSGNANIFDGNERLSLIGSSNNVNEQDFSTQDILGIIKTNERQLMPGSGNRGTGRNQVNPLDPTGGVNGNNQLIGQRQGINTTGMIGANALDSLAHGLFAQGSYFFNNVDNQNIQSDHRIYLLNGDSSNLYDQNSNVESRNYNNRLSARMDYWPNESNGLTVLPVLYFQSNRAHNLMDASSSEGDTTLQSGSNTDLLNTGYNLSSNIILRHRFDMPMQTISLGIGLGSNQKQTGGSLMNYEPNPIPTGMPGDSVTQRLNYLSNSETLDARLIYTQPVAANAIIGLFYNPSLTRSTTSRYIFNLDPVTREFTSPAPLLSNGYSDNYLTQGVGLGYLWRGGGFNLMGYLSYQYSDLQSFDSASSSLNFEKRTGAFLPMALLMYRNPEGKFLRVFFRTYTVAPSVTQLQPVVDNSNPLLLSAGNPNLAQSYNQLLIARYNVTDARLGETMSILLYANRVQNYIGNAYIIPSRDTVLANGTSISQGAQLTYPVNLDGYWNARTYFTFGLPFSLISSSLNLNAGVAYTRTPAIVNGVESVSNTIGPSAGFVIGSNISHDLDFTISYMGNYNFARNTLLPLGNDNYYSHTASIKWFWQFPLKIFLNNQITNELIDGLAKGYDQNIVLWNISIGKKFFAHEAGEVQLSVNDVLNQNMNVQRTITDNYIDDTNNEVLNRYIMLTFSYTVR